MSGILTLKKVTKYYGNGGSVVKALNEVDPEMEKGEFVAIMGPSGSGKSTLLSVIATIEPPSGGDIIIDNKSLRGMKEKEMAAFRRDKLGFVFQDFNLFPQYNVIENVTLAPKLLAKERPDYKENKKQILSEIEEKARGLLERVGLGEKLFNYPCELSSGQKQRVSIARALILDPKILFFDEPTSALDPELTGEILRVIKQLADGNMTMVIVTHEMSFAKAVSSKVIFMDGGVIEEEGTPDEVFLNPQSQRTREFISKFDD